MVIIPDLTFNPSFGSSNDNVSGNAATPSQPPQSTGDFDFAPGQKRPEDA